LERGNGDTVPLLRQSDHITEFGLYSLETLSRCWQAEDLSEEVAEAELGDKRIIATEPRSMGLPAGIQLSKPRATAPIYARQAAEIQSDLPGR
jgi:hypothetical protein